MVPICMVQWALMFLFMLVLQGSVAADQASNMPWTKSCVAGQNNVYVDATNGVDWENRDGRWAKPFKTIQYAVDRREKCTTINVKAGTYTNKGYTGSAKNKNNPNSVVELNGVSDLIIRNVKDNKVVIKFDGTGGFSGGSKNWPISDVEIYGFEIEGPNQNITYADAYADRLKGSNYYNGRGIVIRGGHRIHLHHMLVHDCPGSGMRVDNGDYVVIEDSEVYNNTWWTRGGSSAVVLATSINIDNKDNIKMILRNNKVYNNINKIPYYNEKWAWDYSEIGNIDCSLEKDCKNELPTCPWSCRYGKKTQDYIIDGQGVYVTRNSDTYLKGQMELSGNTCYGNGINGLEFHRTFRGVVRDNFIYDNGAVPRDGHPEPIVEDWMAPLAKARHPHSGLVLNNADGVRLWGNKVRARYDDDRAFAMVMDSGHDYDLTAGGNNHQCRGRVDVKLDPYVREGSGIACASWFPDAFQDAQEFLFP